MSIYKDTQEKGMKKDCHHPPTSGIQGKVTKARTMIMIDQMSTLRHCCEMHLLYEGGGGTIFSALWSIWAKASGCRKTIS